MIGGEASPDVIPDNGHLSSSVLLDAPHAHWLVAADLIQEVGLENGIVSKQKFFLLSALDVSEMRVVCEREATVRGQATEGDITLNFM